jgi:1-deoxy-D-xylulose-5-phosphate reductoisomerase
MAADANKVTSVNNTANVCVLGATGSIGLSTLDVIKRHPERYKVHSLTAYNKFQDLYVLCERFAPEFAVMVDEDAAQQLEQLIRQAGLPVKVLAGSAALVQVASAPEVDIVMAAIVGAAGLPANLAAAREGKKILLANKESLVMSGALFMKEVEENSAVLLPIDSEHNAIFQCLPASYRCGSRLNDEVRRVMLTASGGPFRGFSRKQIEAVTVAQACKHPNWNMGQKISVDSASLMNKGLELIEACWLFNIKPAQIDVHVHPESIVHSMVEYQDGSVLAQMGNPDMRTPIAYGLAWPERIDSGVSSLDLFAIANLSFERPDHDVFPCLGLAEQAFNAGGTACATLNAANEMAVDAFLKGNIPFHKIPDIISRVLSVAPANTVDSIDKVLTADLLARQLAKEEISKLSLNRVGSVKAASTRAGSLKTGSSASSVSR